MKNIGYSIVRCQALLKVLISSGTFDADYTIAEWSTRDGEHRSDTSSLDH